MSARTCLAMVVSSIFLLLLSGCQSNLGGRLASGVGINSQHSSDDTRSTEDFVATDLVSVLMQLPEFDPWRTTIQINAPETPFDKAVEKALRNGNLGVQIVVSDLGNNYLTSEVSSVESNYGVYNRYRLVVGRRSLERDYINNEGKTFPQSLVKLTGIAPLKIALYPDLFVQQGGEGITFPSGVMFRNQRGEWVPQNERYVTVSSARPRNAADQFTHERFLVLAKTQAYFAKRPTRSVDIRRWKPVSQVKLVFPGDDTSFMGANNKKAVNALINNFDPESHGFSITGCQNKTLIWDGTQSDSLDRQLRVRRELFAAGISPDVVQENGCFRSDFSSLLTRNAVIVTLHRKPIS